MRHRGTPAGPDRRQPRGPSDGVPLPGGADDRGTRGGHRAGPGAGGPGGAGTGRGGAGLGPLVWIKPGSRGPARASAALSSVADSPTLGFARAGAPPPRRLPPPPCICTHRAPLPDPA
ncbi:hypothetical protein SGPA1_12048 [Streptomyces misionensis JCM 4497]